jgi:hypothetical protein
MNPPSCASPLSVASLLEYWLGEMDAAREIQIDEHLLGCGRCSANLQSVIEIGGGIRAAVRAGGFHGVLSNAFLKRLAAHGLRLREYRVAPNRSVNCTVAPDDDLLVARLEAPLAGIERLDLEHLSPDGEVERLRDLPFDVAAGEVVIAPAIERIRALPASITRMRLLAVAPSGERLVGEYTFHHTPWPAPAA